MTKNLLVHETSPYLLQHKDNPVHWYPWGEKAFAAAKNLDKPILLSIGYAACHWCHVMAHESFEDQSTADLMNANFVNIKIDREEFPDVDKLYMDAIHILGERGGWPLTVFLEPDGTPFWGGTYFPNKPQYGRPGFQQILTALAQTWTNQREKISTNKNAILKALKNNQDLNHQPSILTQDHLFVAAKQIVNRTDQALGGLQGAPKFPQTTIYNFLWQMYLKTGNENFRKSVLTTLTNLSQGGIYDHLAGGFSRYSVDERWLVTHFKKMLYDNALILDLLITVYNKEKTELFRRRIEETVNWLLEEMITTEGAFAASYDADSEGEEGTFYVWSYQQVLEVIPEPNQTLFCKTYGVTENGNWEGKNILNRLHYPADLSNAQEIILTSSKEHLLRSRSSRIKPGWDDKTLADWSGLAITMLCNAGFALSHPEWIEKAEQIFTQTKKLLWKKDGLRHAYRAGKTTNVATAEDYANLIKAALSLFEATTHPQFLKDAEVLTDQMNKYHWNEQSGGYFFASSKAKNLLVRNCEAHDEATPNANGTMMINFTKLFHLTGHTRYSQKSHAILNAFSSSVISSPMAFTGLLTGFLSITEHFQAVIALPNKNQNIDSIIQKLKTSKYQLTIYVLTEKKILPAQHPAYGKVAINNKPTIYICKGQVCAEPITDLSNIEKVLGEI